MVDQKQNTLEIQWLRNNPGRLVTHYQYIVEVTVAKFILRGFFDSGEKMEIVQEINLRLLESKMQKIQEHFRGTVLLRTYFSKVTYNCCLEICRQRQRQATLLSEDQLTEFAESEINAYDQLVIRDELLRLHACIKGLHGTYFKGRICLKGWIRFLFNNQDIQFYDSPKTSEAIAAIKANMYEPYDHLNDHQVNALLTALFNLVEDKKTEPDSLRKWMINILDHFIVLLNGNPPVSAHSRSSLKILLQYYFDWQEKSVNI
ncbi:MAG: hypothetical protein DHS20C18_46140 [Saprospiraceae bacterium]|nr:MAG: hypothetical protein DHS20C18_46140 [Saprospiraceae bacterium]